ncbi:class I SAM-dependent methyltransferase [Neobacillus sp. SM06]|uniref:class I SAM-dependent methyltransferase n=1 Tax=Neobacillus sp. SM06 TaxID=3422492 RepID=UPI003D2735E4
MISFLRQLIERSPSNLITYSDYIGTVLYNPQYGYYMKEKQKIGREGDFFTTSNVSDVFGRIMAKWFSQLIRRHQLPPVFCEIGAGNGRFARAFLEEWKESVQTPLSYRIVEMSPYHRKLQNELLQSDFDVEQYKSLLEVPSFEGILFSNELFDALPVHVIEKVDGRLYEIMIGFKEGKLYEQRVPIENKAIQAFLKESGLHLGNKQRIEIPLSMHDMLKQFAAVLTKGIVITVDYGYSNEDWMEPAKKNGSLRGYYQHQMVENVLLHPGEMDITSHVHFDWLRQKGEECQLEFVTQLRQDEFLLKAGILKELADHYDPNPFSAVSKRNRAIRSLIMPSGMSSSFHVVAQQKNMKLKTEKELFENE